MACNFNHLNRYLLTGGVLIFLVLMIVYPAVVYHGAVTGLQTWWNIVFPSLLPFFIISEIMLSTGIVHFLGVITEPIMRPVFNIPGAGSFAVAVGYASGFPVGAMITAKLRKERLCTRVEAERMLCFTNNSSPLFMLVAVAVGMFNNPALGFYIAGTHYLANITVGVGLRFYGLNDPERSLEPAFKPNLLRRAINEFTFILAREQRPLGQILGDAVKNSINNLLNVGGFIIIFAVLIMLLTECHAIDFIARALGMVLSPFKFDPSLYPALASGLFEMTIGTKLASETMAPLAQQVVIVSMILGWNGISILAQVASMISETDIRILPFVGSRLAHATLAGLYTVLVFKFNNTMPVISSTIEDTLLPYFTLAGNLMISLKHFILLVGVLIALALIAHLTSYVINHYGFSLIRRR